MPMDSVTYENLSGSDLVIARDGPHHVTVSHAGQTVRLSIGSVGRVMDAVLALLSPEEETPEQRIARERAAYMEEYFHG